MSEEKNNTLLPPPMDYTMLRDYGLEYIKSIASSTWTDFSVHDPGVTIFEALSLALADLSYRSSASMNDLLTRKGGSSVSLEGTLFPPQDILAQAPTTISDYRKLILEHIPHVRNVWLKTVTRRAVFLDESQKNVVRDFEVKGFYDVCLELDDDDIIKNDVILGEIMAGYGYTPFKDNYKTAYRDFVRGFLLAHRNLCEDIRDVTILEPVDVGINVDIQLEAEADVTYIIQAIYDKVSKYISPEIQRYSLDELLAKGRSLDEIYGPRVPVAGFVDRDELEGFKQTRELYISDVISLIMQIDGVKSVRHARFIVKDSVSVHFKGFPEGNHISLNPDATVSFSMTPRFVRRDTPRDGKLMNVVTFTRGYFSFYPPASENGSTIIRLPDHRERIVGIKSIPDIPKGKYRSLDRYFSFQNLLPPTYRMGVDTLPDSAGKLRKAERMQLKAYLTFFDKILSDYLAQIDSFLDLLSVEPAAKDTVDATYFHHYMTDADIVDVSEVLKGYPDYTVDQESQESALKRKNVVLNHLMSRFCDSFAEYAILEFVRGKAAEEFSMRERVEDKKRMLKDYASISSLRSAAADYTRPWTVSGAERRIMRKLGVNDEDISRPVIKHDKLNIHLIEHNLLVPRMESTAFLHLAQAGFLSSDVPDPYSYRITAILPGWPDVCLIRTYREHVERVIREELPAHILVKVCWVSKHDLFRVEKALWEYNICMNSEKYPLTNLSNWRDSHLEAVCELGTVISSLTNIYEKIVIYPDDHADSIADSALRLDFAGLDDDWRNDPMSYGEILDSLHVELNLPTPDETLSLYERRILKSVTSEDKGDVGPEPEPSVPKPEPAPVDPEPEPKPEPVPVEPEPEPQPEPVPVEPEPEPEPEPVPVEPEPEPQPAPADPEPEPEPVPVSYGESPRIVVLTASEAMATTCRKAGAKHAGLVNLVKKIANGWTDYDIVICEEESKSNLSKLDAILTPIGLMPSYGNGTIVLRSKLVSKVKEIIERAKPSEPAPVIQPMSVKRNEPAEPLAVVIKALQDQSGRKLSTLLSSIETEKKKQ